MQGGTITTDRVWDFGGAPVHLANDVTINAPGSLTVSPGSVIKRGTGVSLTASTGPLLAVYCHADPIEQTRWGFARVGVHRWRFLRSALDGLDAELQLRGNRLQEVEAPTVPGLIELCKRMGVWV